MDYEALAIKSGIPEYMVGGIIRWIEHGIPPGDFLTAIINNDLKEACGRADDTNRNLLFNYVQFFYNYAPSQCWGSPHKTLAWGERFDEVAAVNGSEGKP